MPKFGAPAASGSATYVQDADPGAVGAGATWLQTNAAGGAGYNQLWVRKAGDDGWWAGGPMLFWDPTFTAIAAPDDSVEFSTAHNFVQLTAGASDLQVENAAVLFNAFGDVPICFGVSIAIPSATQIRQGTADPSAGAGVAAPIKSLYLRDNSGAGELWIKDGAADTGWFKIH